MSGERTSLLQAVLQKTSKQKAMQYGCLTVDMPVSVEDAVFYDKCGALTQKQIAQYANDPWWLNLRRGLMISFWASMALMILAAVLIAIVEHEHVCVAGKSLTLNAVTLAPPPAVGGGAVLHPERPTLPTVTVQVEPQSDENGTSEASLLHPDPVERVAYVVDSGGKVLGVISAESSEVAAGDGHRRSIFDWLKHI